MIRSESDKLTSTANTKHVVSNRITRVMICTYPLVGIYWLHPGTMEMTCIVSTVAWRLPIMAHFWYCLGSYAGRGGQGENAHM